VESCGNPKMEDHLFFNCLMLDSIWREIVKWLEVLVVLPEGGQNHLFLLKNLVPSNIKTRDWTRVIWFSTISLTWQTRNEMIFNQIVFYIAKIIRS
jgi:hypothetical protein